MIDVYHGTGRIDWKRVFDASHHVAFCKATQGSGYVDSALKTNLAGMKEAGLRRGVYHFAVLDGSGSAQAHCCLDAAITAGFDPKGDLPIALDLEPDPRNPGVEDRVGRDRVRAFVSAFSGVILEETGKLPILYGDCSFLNAYLGDGYGGHPLWLARYAPNMGPLPQGWGTWHIWQYSETGQVDGIAGNVVDLDRWNPAHGDLTTWQVL